MDIKNQPHYAQFPIPIMLFCQANGIGWCAANVIKYVSRADAKGGLEDLEKAKHYLECLIEYKKTGDLTSLKQSHENFKIQERTRE